MPSKRQQRRQQRFEYERYLIHQLVWDHPSRTAWWAFFKTYRTNLFWLIWLNWICFWAGIAIASGDTIGMIIQLVVLPFALLTVLRMAHRYAVNVTKVTFFNIHETNKWLREHGYDPTDPPKWVG